MSFVVQCPGCAKPSRVSETAIGKQARCPGCGLVFPVPAPARVAEEAPPAPAAAPVSGGVLDFLDEPASASAPPSTGGYSPMPAGGYLPRPQPAKDPALTVKIVGGIVGGVVAMAVVSALTLHVVRGGVEGELAKAAAEVNRGTPMQVDPITRLDKAVAGPGKTFTYLYTVTRSLRPAEKQNVQSAVTRKALTSPEMKSIFDAGVTVWYKYRDPNGTPILEFSVKR